jgi:hypothetical protein
MPAGDEHGHGRYVRQVSEQLHVYTQTLLSENEQLRMAVESLRLDMERLRDEAAATQHAWRENETLKERLRHIQEERNYLRDQLETTRQALHAFETEKARLASRLTAITRDNHSFLDQFVSLQQQNNNLANLYVAGYRLHETLDWGELITVLQEILVNLVGSEEIAIFELDPHSRVLALVASNGIQPETYAKTALGEGWIGQTAQTGGIFIRDHAVAAASTREENLTACIPLKIGTTVTGAIAIFRLLPQKPGIEEADHEIFDLLASQAATALYCARLHSRLGGSVDQLDRRV